MIKVSVIVPVYNSALYLDKCLDSLVNQTLKDIEIIVVNDGSTDNSQEIINKYIKKDKRIVSIVKGNGGLGDARNYGIKKATGKYIGFVDSDDHVDLNMYEDLYKTAEKENSDIVECNFYWSYKNKLKEDKPKYNYDSKEDIFNNIRVMVCNKIFRKELVIKNKIMFPQGVKYEDILFTYKILPHVNKISYIGKAYYYYIQRQNSLSNNQNEKTKDIFVLLDEIKKYYKSNNIYNDYKDNIEYINIRYLLGSSFLRIIKIENRVLREKILKENWQFLNIRFPNWKSNKYLKTKLSSKKIYYLIVNKFTYNIFACIFRLIRR